MSEQKNISYVDFHGFQRSYKRLLCREDGWGFALLMDHNHIAWNGEKEPMWRWYNVRSGDGQWIVVNECSAEQCFILASIEMP
jgi:hypothetical protein